MKKVRIIALILVLSMAAFMLSACGGSGTQSSPAPAPGAGDASPPPAAPSSDETFVLRIGTGTGGRHHQNIFMEAYKEALEAASGGRIEVQLYPAGQLGTMIELVQGIVDGSIESGCFPATYFSIISPEIACLDIAYTFNDSSQMWRTLHNNNTLYQQAFEKNDITVGAWLRNADRQIISTSPINNIDDLKGKILWSIPSRVIQEEVVFLGGVPSGLDTGEVAPAIQNGTIDGSVQDISLYASQSLHNAGAKYLLNATTGALITVYAISNSWLNKLPADLKAMVVDVSRQVAVDVHFPYSVEYGVNSLESMLGEGMGIVEPSAQLLADMRAALAPQADWFMGLYPDAKPIYDELLQYAAGD